MTDKTSVLIPSGIVINVICKRLIVAANELKKSNKKLADEIKALTNKGLYWSEMYKTICFITSTEESMRHYAAVLSDKAKRYHYVSFHIKELTYTWQKIRKVEVAEGKKKLFLFEVGYNDSDTAWLVAATWKQARKMSDYYYSDSSLNVKAEVSVNDYYIGLNEDKNVLTTKWWIDYLNQLTDNYFKPLKFTDK